MKYKDKKRIKYEIRNRTDHDRDHSSRCVALRVNKRIHAGRKHRWKRADQIDHHVRIRIDERGLRCPEQNKERSGKQKADHHKYHRTCTDHRKRCIDHILRPLRLTHSTVDREDRRPAASEQIAERRNDDDQWKTQSHRTKRRRTNIRDTRNINSVHNIIEQTQNLRYQHRQRSI